MKTIIHVNQHIIKANIRSGRDDPAIIVRTYKGRTNVKEVKVNGPLTFFQSMDKPLDCGARIWAETNSNVEIIR